MCSKKGEALYLFDKKADFFVEVAQRQSALCKASPFFEKEKVRDPTGTIALLN
ncbi:hypothetical protein [Fischerella thermalis]|uniref:hypothetical protein n=1 Tax=Fischerella thermalis TaxID=372787 RepID=UPI0015E0EA5A|nr:hypothetical protein [Fischerella thermalis]